MVAGSRPEAVAGSAGESARQQEAEPAAGDKPEVVAVSGHYHWAEPVVGSRPAVLAVPEQYHGAEPAAGSSPAVVAVLEHYR